MVIHDQPERLRYNSDQPTAMTDVLVATSGLSYDTGGVGSGRGSLGVESSRHMSPSCPLSSVPTVGSRTTDGQVGPSVNLHSATRPPRYPLVSS
jgi:hypothetical protein